MNWKLIFVITLCTLAAISSIAFFALEKSFSKTVTEPDTGFRAIQLAGRTLHVSVVETPADRARGLSGRTSLQPYDGMLFVFDRVAKHGLWMKDMLIRIDMLWLSDKGEVLYIEENVSPATYPKIFTPDVPARYVLELPAGFVKGYNVAVGDILRL
jgi:uncharacterized protein